MLTVDHRLTLGSPAFPSAPDKESFSRVSSPIFACNVFTSTVRRRARSRPVMLGITGREFVSGGASPAISGNSR
ncbi:hypothetical protein ACVIVC_000983 [Sinorhizobium meliloti]